MEWFTARELAGMPGMPGTEQGVRKKADAESWSGRKRAGTKAIEYPLSALPTETQEAILKSLITPSPAVPAILVSATTAPPAPSSSRGGDIARDLDSLRFWQRDIMHYRCCILNVIDRMALALGTRHRAVDAFLRMMDATDCPPQYIMYVEQANARKGGGRRLSAGTIYRWFELRLKGGDIALAPSNADKPL